ncbi:hypothetical protein [Flavobacterium sp. K5-23]|uniref:hypothetical protein n=1 Tax=Flavobacterium sp. K5-23 TaxID=2746225 RepID=UPI00200F5D67|nr:hypothetical protein [Flavobacterium sp. K5-23]UQD55913.1 hypothetical protein FLAK523_05670 [Flavobacterium sp. K5-23]
MNKIDLIKGFVLGITVSIIGSLLFITIFTEFDCVSGIKTMKAQGYLGKIITLGSIPNLILFAVLLKLNKEMMARGVVLAVIIMTVITLFI